MALPGDMDVEPFHPRFPWYGRHLQSMRNPLRPAPPLAGGAGRRLGFAMADGDVLQARYDAPAAKSGTTPPTILLVHGLGGCETSNYMLAASAYLTARGCAVIRLSLRGAGPSQATCRDWSHAGRHGDLEEVVRALDAPPLGLVVIGFSLGGNLLLNYLARGAVDPRIVAAATVSAPLDLPSASEVLHAPRNRLYHAYLLRALKADYLNPYSNLDMEERAAVTAARTIFEVDDRITAPRHGFGSADVYYREVSSLPHLARIEVATLLVHAADDPFIPPDPYRRVEGAAVTPLVAAGGGHLGFHDRAGLWHLRQIERFLATIGHPLDRADGAARGLPAAERSC